MKTLTMSDLHSVMKTLTTDALILDVRTQAEFSEGHVPGAANIPVDQVMVHAEELKKFKNIYIYCRAGARAETACDILSSMGVKGLSCVDQGGFPNWQQAGFETET
jgi:phage shock protein E